VGRPDLAVDPDTKPEEMAGYLFDSLQKIKELDGKIRVYPAHGGGSACGGKGISNSHFETLDHQRENNKHLKVEDKLAFIKDLCTGISSPPEYFAFDAKLNESGASPYKEHLEKAGRPLNVEEFQQLSEKLPVIDSRAEPELLIKGKNIYWLTAKGTLVGWVSKILPSPETEYLLFTDAGKWEETAERLIRVGFFNIRGYNNFAIDAWQGETWKPTIYKFDHVKEEKDLTFLDVRNEPEFKSTGVVEGAILIPLPDLPKRAHELKDHKNIVVHCRTGMRARVAASILAQHGIESAVLAESTFLPT
jgi:hydroxyacylglutathione hydrolase